MKMLTAALAATTLATGLAAAATPADAKTPCACRCPVVHHRIVHHAIVRRVVRRQVVYHYRPAPPPPPEVVYEEAPPPPPIFYDQPAYYAGPVWYGGPRHFFHGGWRGGWVRGGPGWDGGRHPHHWR
jgi:hypothetical protein